MQAKLTLLTQNDVPQSTTVLQFLKRRDVLGAGQGPVSILQHLLDLVSQIENTSLLPYMKTATLSECGLDVVFRLVMNANLGIIFCRVDNRTKLI